MKILFITSNRVGDAVLSTGLLAALVEQYPQARLTIVCGPYAADLFRAVPGLERIIILKKQSWNRHWIALWRELFPARWDMIVDLRNSLVSRLLPARKRHYAVRRNGIHKVFENALALDLSPAPAPHLWLDDAAVRAAASLTARHDKILALGPAANWPAKQWPMERFTELAQKLTAADGLLAGASVMIIVDEREREQIAPLLSAFPKEQRIEVIGRNLLTVAACLKQAALFVGNDSGLMHIAAARGTKTLGLFGPGYEEIYGPWGMHSAFVRSNESREELLARLPHPGAHQPNLMGGLSVEKVLDAAKLLLKN